MLVFVNSRMKELRVLLDGNITLFLKPEPATREQYIEQRLEIELFEKRVAKIRDEVAHLGCKTETEENVKNMFLVVINVLDDYMGLLKCRWTRFVNDCSHLFRRTVN